jgi:hypothetical protein
MRKLWVAGLVVALASSSAWAQKAPGVEEELANAKREIAELRAQYEALLKRVEGAEQRVVESRGSDELIKLVGDLGEAEPSIKWKSRFAGLTLMPYGYIKADVAYDVSKTPDVNQPAFVLPEGVGPFDEQDDELGITSMQTRLGLNISGPDALDAKTSGTVEVDFYGTLAPENKAKLMMRRAFVKMDWGSVWVLAGQEWELFSPGAPDVLNYPYLALAGSPGYRRPLVAVGGKVGLGDLTVDAAVAAVRVMGEITTFGSGLVKDTGGDSGWPALQGRVGVSLPSHVPDKRFVVGVSGVAGEEEVDTLVGGVEHHFTTWGVCADGEVPVFALDSVALVLKGEAWIGENMDEWLGGIGQGVDFGRMDVIAAAGGWGQATVELGTDTKINLGAGFDNPQNGDLTVNAVNTIPRTSNVVYYGNIKQKLSKQLTLGFEVMYFDTNYLVLGRADNLRFQLSAIFDF